MLRYLKYAFLLVAAFCLVTMALANTQTVTLQLLPQELADLTDMGYEVTVPMFVVVLGAVALGLLIGFVWEWLRETKHRTEASRRGREARQLQREVSRLKRANNEDQDDVLALLEEPRKAG